MLTVRYISRMCKEDVKIVLLNISRFKRPKLYIFMLSSVVNIHCENELLYASKYIITEHCIFYF